MVRNWNYIFIYVVGTQKNRLNEWGGFFWSDPETCLNSYVRKKSNCYFVLRYFSSLDLWGYDLPCVLSFLEYRAFLGVHQDPVII